MEDVCLGGAGRVARNPSTGASYPICATLESGLFRDSGWEASSAWKWGDCWMLPAWRWPVFPSRGGGPGNAGERKSALPDLSNGGTAKRLAKKANRRRAQGGASCRACFFAEGKFWPFSIGRNAHVSSVTGPCGPMDATVARLPADGASEKRLRAVGGRDAPSGKWWVAGFMAGSR